MVWLWRELLREVAAASSGEHGTAQDEEPPGHVRRVIFLTQIHVQHRVASVAGVAAADGITRDGADGVHASGLQLLEQDAVPQSDRAGRNTDNAPESVCVCVCVGV